MLLFSRSTLGVNASISMSFYFMIVPKKILAVGLPSRTNSSGLMPLTLIIDTIPTIAVEKIASCLVDQVHLSLVAC